MGIVIRQIKEEEIKEVYELERHVFQPINYPQFVLKQFYDLMPDLFLVAANESNEILGYTQGGINMGKKTGWILRKSWMAKRFFWPNWPREPSARKTAIYWEPFWL